VKGPWLWIVICANLAVLIALVFVYPHLMVGPGALEAGHAELAADCFACHTPLRGATADRCIACHALPGIGLRTTKGAAIVHAKPLKTSFHQSLNNPDCMACHSDHAGPKLTKRSRKPFSHVMLRADTRERCETCHAAPDTVIHRKPGMACSKCHKMEAWKPAAFDHAALTAAERSRCETCHAAPDNAIHRNPGMACAKCHKTEAWKPAAFDHTALTPAERSRCEACHQAPADALHKQMTGICAQCHQTQAWKPATFDHDKFFALDGDHNVSCVTCHTGNVYSRYTCYGCHEHTPANMQARHREEGGGGNLDNCVRCHRSASGEGGGEHGRERGSGGRERD
jgi:hypothetical protein